MSLALDRQRTVKDFEGLVVSAAHTRAKGDRDLFADLAQEARIRVVQVLRDHPEAKPSYVRSAIVNRIADVMRSRASRSREAVDLGEDLAVEDLIATDDLGDALADASELSGILAAVRLINADYADAILACAAHGDADSAAGSLGISVPAYKARLYRSRDLAAKIASGESFEPIREPGPQPSRYQDFPSTGSGAWKSKGDRWSLSQDACVKCGTTEVDHMARGLCKRCYSNARYHGQIEKEKAKRKAKRLQGDEKNLARAAAWRKANPDRDRQIKRDWQRRTHGKWPVGATVRLSVESQVLTGTIEQLYKGKPWRADVRLTTGHKIGKVSVKDLVRFDAPEEAKRAP